jgi:thioredoxin-related protein
MHKRSISIVFLCFFTCINTITFRELSAQDTLEKRIKFDPIRNPETDLRNAILRAQKSGKRILLDVGGEWCIWCHRVDEFLLKNEDLNKYLHNNFIVIKVNYSPENKNVQFLSHYPKITGYPHIFILDKDGKFLHSQDTGKLEEGKGYNHQKFLQFLKNWAPEQLKRVN